MLPSGNDAAIALAEFFGKKLFLESEEYRIRV
jgi:D-alanyl-D-alanine carboxypeptidase